MHLLVVAGHDSSAGAGVDADAEAATHVGVRATTVVTANTEQNGRRVFSVRSRDPQVWLAEARRARDVDALKFGMLPGGEHVRAAVELIGDFSGLPLVVDPVLAASDGTDFLDADGQRVLLEELLPLGPVLTPNLPEAQILVGRRIEPDDLEGRVELARELLARGARAVVLKGGHGSEDPVRDLVFEANAEPLWLEHPRARGASLHGSGCRFASAVAGNLATGRPLAEAASLAGDWLLQLLEARS